VGSNGDQGYGVAEESTSGRDTLLRVGTVGRVCSWGAIGGVRGKWKEGADGMLAMGQQWGRGGGQGGQGGCGQWPAWVGVPVSPVRGQVGEIWHGREAGVGGGLPVPSVGTQASKQGVECGQEQARSGTGRGLGGASQRMVRQNLWEGQSWSQRRTVPGEIMWAGGQGEVCCWVWNR